MEVVLFMEVLFIEQQLEFPIFILHGTKIMKRYADWTVVQECAG